MTVNPRAIAAFERYTGIIPDYDDFLESLQHPPAVFIRANTLKVGLASFRERMTAGGYALEPVPGMEEAFLLRGAAAPGSTLEYFLGYYHVQGLTSMLPARILDPRPGELVLDLCAAPGGKATHVAQMMQNRGLVVANDVRLHRISILRFHIDRLGAVSVSTTGYFGQSFPGQVQFDRVLLDPPCSSEGTYRAGSRSLLTETPGTLARFNRLQSSLLDRALAVLRPGGMLVYSTCTYAPEENEMVIDPFIRDGRAEVLPLSVPFAHAPGVTGWEGRALHPDLARAARFYPHQINSWGFFLARLRKPC